MVFLVSDIFLKSSKKRCKNAPFWQLNINLQNGEFFAHNDKLKIHHFHIYKYRWLLYSPIFERVACRVNWWHRLQDGHKCIITQEVSVKVLTENDSDKKHGVGWLDVYGMTMEWWMLWLWYGVWCMFYVWLLYELYVYGGDRRIRYDVWAGCRYPSCLVFFCVVRMDTSAPSNPQSFQKKQLRANKWTLPATMQ